MSTAKTFSSHSTALPAPSPEAPGAPEWIQLLPLGTFSGRDGRGPYHVNDPEAVIAATREYHGNTDIPLDYNHQTEFASQNGKPAPAAGWIKELETRPDGIWARVEWTEAGARAVAENLQPQNSLEREQCVLTLYNWSISRIKCVSCPARVCLKILAAKYEWADFARCKRALQALHTLMMVVAAAPAKLLGAESLEFAFGKGLQGIAHCGLTGIVIHRDARRLHGVERAHAHAASQQRADALRGQFLHGLEAIAVLMSAVGQHAHIADGPVFHKGQSIGVTVAEMCAGHSFQAAGRIRGNSHKNSLTHWNFSLNIVFSGQGAYTAFNAQRPPFNQGLGHTVTRLAQQPAESMPRNPHEGGGLVHVQALVVRQPHSFQAIHGQHGFREFAQRNAPGLEIGRFGESGYAAAMAGSGHGRLNYFAQMSI